MGLDTPATVTLEHYKVVKIDDDSLSFLLQVFIFSRFYLIFYFRIFPRFSQRLLGADTSHSGTRHTWQLPFRRRTSTLCVVPCCLSVRFFSVLPFVQRAG